MKKIALYKYDEAHSTPITPVQRNSTDIPYMYRLIADEGKILHHADYDDATVVDVFDEDGWEDIQKK